MYIAVLEYLTESSSLSDVEKDTSRPFARARIKKQNRDACDRFHVHISERTNREIIQYKSGLSIIIFL